jgi:hypothetical protein
MSVIYKKYCSCSIPDISRAILFREQKHAMKSCASFFLLDRRIRDNRQNHCKLILLTQPECQLRIIKQEARSFKALQWHLHSIEFSFLHNEVFAVYHRSGNVQGIEAGGTFFAHTPYSVQKYSTDIIQPVVSDETIWAGRQIPPNPPLAKGGNFRIVSIVTPSCISSTLN